MLCKDSFRAIVRQQQKQLQQQRVEQQLLRQQRLFEGAFGAASDRHGGQAQKRANNSLAFFAFRGSLCIFWYGEFDGFCSSTTVYWYVVMESITDADSMTRLKRSDNGMRMWLGDRAWSPSGAMRVAVGVLSSKGKGKGQEHCSFHSWGEAHADRKVVGVVRRCLGCPVVPEVVQNIRLPVAKWIRIKRPWCLGSRIMKRIRTMSISDFISVHPCAFSHTLFFSERCTRSFIHPASDCLQLSCHSAAGSGQTFGIENAYFQILFSAVLDLPCTELPSLWEWKGLVVTSRFQASRRSQCSRYHCLVLWTKRDWFL